MREAEQTKRLEVLRDFCRKQAEGNRNLVSKGRELAELQEESAACCHRNENAVAYHKRKAVFVKSMADGYERQADYWHQLADDLDAILKEDEP